VDIINQSKAKKMNAAQRSLKKMTIILVIVGFISAVVYFLTRPEPDPCFDGVKNGYEEGIDCGGLCDRACAIPDRPAGVEAIKINWVKLVPDGNNTYDFVANLSNANKDWGAESVDYVFTYYDAGGKELGTKQGTASISPRGDNEKNSVKYIIENDVNSSARIDKVALTLSNYRWQQIADAQELFYRNEFSVDVVNRNFAVDDQTKIYMGTGTTKNSSKYDFVNVYIAMVVYGRNGDVLAVARTNQKTVGAGHGWGFAVPFPNLTVEGSEIDHVDFKAETDVFNKKNFLRGYRAEE
jgi:hypothetical protein